MGEGIRSEGIWGEGKGIEEKIREKRIFEGGIRDGRRYVEEECSIEEDIWGGERRWKKRSGQEGRLMFSEECDTLVIKINITSFPSCVSGSGVYAVQAVFLYLALCREPTSHLLGELHYSRQRKILQTLVSTYT